MPHHIPYFGSVFSGIESFDAAGVSSERRKDIEAVCFGLVAYEDSSTRTEPIRWFYYTQAEACVGLGPSIRLGINPGEILDFLFGWTTIDLFGDDLEWQRRKPNKTPGE